MKRLSVPVAFEIPISKDLYFPSAGELRSAYAVKSLSRKTSDLDRIIELGNALNRRIQYCQVDWMLKILTCLCDTLNPPFQSTLLLHNYQALWEIDNQADRSFDVKSIWLDVASVGSATLLENRLRLMPSMLSFVHL
jgi:hypothetical protein